MSNQDFVGDLADPVGWLAEVISNFVSYNFDPETCTIRWGITGTGVAPNYMIEGPSRVDTICLGNWTGEMVAIPARIFNGRHHREMTWLDDRCRRDENWSEDRMTFDDAKILLSQLS